MTEQDCKSRLTNRDESTLPSADQPYSKTALPSRPKLTLRTSASALNQSHVANGAGTVTSNAAAQQDLESHSDAETELDSDTSTLLEACQTPSPKADRLSPQNSVNVYTACQYRQARKERWQNSLKAFKARLTPIFFTGYRTGREDTSSYAGFHAYEAANARHNASKDTKHDLELNSMKQDEESRVDQRSSSSNSISSTAETTNASLSSASTAVASCSSSHKTSLSSYRTRKPSLLKRGFTRMQTDPEEKAWLKAEKQKKREEEHRREAVRLMNLYGYDVGMALDDRGYIDWRVAWAGAAIF